MFFYSAECTAMAKFQMILAAVLCIAPKGALSEAHQHVNPNAPSENNWKHPSSIQTLQQQQQHAPAVFLTTSTHHPAEGAAVFQQTPQSRRNTNSDSSNRHFEFGDPTVNSVAAALPPMDQDSISRHYGYLNVHRFDPNYPYYERSMYLRYPFVQTSRYGPGYRKDKYGHGYGYSCKQGDDCDKLRAANQFPSSNPPPPIIPSAFPQPHVFPQHIGSPYPDIPLIPPYPQFSNHYPARFQDTPFLSSPPAHFYHGRYLHDQAEEEQLQMPA